MEVKYTVQSFPGRSIPKKSLPHFTVAALDIIPCPKGRSKFYSTGLLKVKNSKQCEIDK